MDQCMCLKEPCYLCSLYEPCYLCGPYADFFYLCLLYVLLYILTALLYMTGCMGLSRLEYLLNGLGIIFKSLVLVNLILNQNY